MIFYSGQSTLENKKNNTYFEEKEQNFKINVENSKKIGRRFFRPE